MRSSLLSSFFVLSSLWLVAKSQDNIPYPDCVPVACTSLQVSVLASCQYDLSKSANATPDETICICKIPGVNISLQSCFDCLDRDPVKDNANYFAEICPELSVTRAGTTTSVILGGSSAPTKPPTKTSASIATSTKIATDAINTSLTTNMPDSGYNTGTDTGTSTNTDTDTDTDSSPGPTVLVDLETTSTSNGAASHYTPVFGLAAILMMAQAGL